MASSSETFTVAWLWASACACGAGGDWPGAGGDCAAAKKDIGTSKTGKYNRCKRMGVSLLRRAIHWCTCLEEHAKDGVVRREVRALQCAVRRGSEGRCSAEAQ